MVALPRRRPIGSWDHAPRQELREHLGVELVLFRLDSAITPSLRGSANRTPPSQLGISSPHLPLSFKSCKLRRPSNLQ